MKIAKEFEQAAKETLRVFQSKGGRKTLLRYGKKHFSLLGKKGMAIRWGKKGQK